MGQDLRKMFEAEAENSTSKLTSGHENRFLDKLEEALPEKRKGNYPFLWIAAASVVVLVSLGIWYQSLKSVDNPQETIVQIDSEEEKGLSLGDISPDLKKIENYYVSNINYQLSQVESTEETKALFDSYMDQLNELTDEFQLLNKELNEFGPNELIVGAQIDNLQKRLQLMLDLNEKIKELKESKNEQFNNQSI
ncbi:hypothetical protein [Spongiivirga citrea]|uniref:Anti-sigma factor n=1 Tax=Spongiivirga citrea TaxID=1481457 RepID=A0A6M0CE75_9FLAO|nr:hypothetical protein [Spongiivirga citrea]NER16031.1 hypothetical protein [Spongiivirga citrea]